MCKGKSDKVVLLDDWSPELMELVGRIIAAFGQLEWVVFITAKRKSGKSLCEFDSEGKKFKDPFATWCRRLVQGYPEDERLSALVERARCASEARNDVVHAVWGRRKSDRRIGRWRRGFDLGIELDPLKDLLSTIRALRDDINQHSKTALKKSLQERPD